MSNPILSDHKRKGKRFIPPLMAALDFNEVSWIKDTLPELLWIGLLIDSFDLRQGTELATAVAQAAQNLSDDPSRPTFVFSSDYGSLIDTDKKNIVDELERMSVLQSIQHALMPLCLYPQFPQSFLLSQEQPVGNQSNNLNVIQRLGRVVGELIPRRGRPATLVKTTGVYIAHIPGKIQYTSNVTPPNLESVIDYPGTEESQHLGASVSTTIQMLIGIEKSERVWASYFWNRGLEIDNCYLREDASSDE